MLQTLVSLFYREEVQLVFVFLILFIVICLLWFRWKHRFWIKQPVFHAYKLHYWLYPPGIIDRPVPKMDEYYDPMIRFSDFDKLEQYETDNIIDLLKGHYLQTEDIKYQPSRNSVIPYFKGHNYPSYISFSYKRKAVLDFRNKQVLQKTKPTCIMTTRPMELEYKHKNITHNLLIYYVDYLCTRRDHRKKGITQQNIYTHYVNYRKQTPKNMINFFKREGPQSVYIPMVIYFSYGFSLKRWKQPQPFNPFIKCVPVGKNNMHILQNFLHDNKSRFTTSIIPEMGNIQSLIVTQNYFCFLLMYNDNPIACYFFRNAVTFYSEYAKSRDVPDRRLREKMERRGNSLELIASINGLDNNVENEKLFVQGFYHSLYQILLKKSFQHRVLVIENISNNNRILKNVMKKYKSIFRVQTGYYYYNFALLPEESKNVLVIT